MSAKTIISLAVTALVALSTANAAEPPANLSPSIAQVVKLHDSGVSTDVLLAYVKETPITRPTGDEVLYLTEKGIPKEVIIAMLSKRVWADTPAPQSQPAPAQNHTQNNTQLPPAVTTAPPATQTVVHVQQPAPTVTYVAPGYAYPPYYYSPWYYDPWPAFAVGIGFGYGWGHGWGHGGHWGGHHGGGGIHVHHR